MTITGSTKWDIFVVYILVCVLLIGVCCLFVLFLFWCCPAKERSSGAGLGAAAATSIYLASPTATRIILRRSSSMRRIMEISPRVP
jgi:hypothetical protein